MKIKKRRLFSSIEVEVTPGELEAFLSGDRLGIHLLKWVQDIIGIDFSIERKEEIE